MSIPGRDEAPSCKVQATPRENPELSRDPGERDFTFVSRMPDATAAFKVEGGKQKVSEVSEKVSPSDREKRERERERDGIAQNESSVLLLPNRPSARPSKADAEQSSPARSDGHKRVWQHRLSSFTGNY